MRPFILRFVTVLVMLAPVLMGAESDTTFRNGHALSHAYLRNHWTQVELRLDNTGGEGEQMNAVLSVRDGMKTVKYVRQFYLPANCERTVWFCSQLGGRQRNPVSIVGSDGAKVAEGEELSNVLSGNRILCLVVDEGNIVPPMSMYLGRRDTVEKDAAGSGRRGKRSTMMGANIRHTATLGTLIPSFPDQWAGLDSMGAVAVGKVDHQDWRPSQVEALTRWLRSGGLLLLFPGDSYASLRGSAMEKLLPVEIFGSRRQNRIRLEGKAGSWTVDMDEYVSVLESEVTEGETVLSNGEMPMVVRKRIGMGNIYFFAYDGAVMEEWEQSGSLYAQIFRGSERLKPLAQTGLLEEGPELIDEVVGAEVAPRSFVVVTLGGFLVITALSLAVAHYFRRTELAWAVILPVGVVVGFISYRVGQSYRAEVGRSINEISVLRAGSGADTAFRSAILGVHAEGTLRGKLHAGSDQAFLTATSAKKENRGQITTDFIQVSPRYVARDLTIQPGSFPRYVVNAPVQMEGGIDVELQPGPTGLEGTITNGSSMDLRNCLMAFNSFPFIPQGLQRLKAGESVKFTLNQESVKPRGDFATEAMLGSASLTRKRIVRHLFSASRTQMHSPWTRRLVLLAWPDRDFIDEFLSNGADAEVIKRSSALLCVEARIIPPESGTEVVLPRAFSIPAIRPGRSNRIFPLSRYAGRSMAREVGLLFYLPSFASDVALKKGNLAMSVEAYGYELELHGIDQDTGEKVTLARMKNPSGVEKIEIPRAGRFQNFEQGTLVLGLKSRMETDDEGMSMKGEGRRSSWSLDSVTVRLEGQAR